MASNNTNQLGQTKDVGFQIGVRRTFSLPLEDTWDLLISPRGLQTWLGDTTDIDLGKGAQYTLPDGSTGEIRIFKPNSHLRITHHPKGWPRPSTIQVRVIPNEAKTVIAFHQEHLPGPKERDQRRDHFNAALDQLAVLIA